MTQDSTHDTAGAGSPAPAVVSAAPAGSTDAVPPASVDVVPLEARTELDRVRRRWAELPLARAEGRMPLLRHLLADLADRSADPPVEVPDLGPAVVVDQLAVLVWDAYARERGDGIPDLLTELRRELSSP